MESLRDNIHFLRAADQQWPVGFANVQNYLGIDLNIPDRDWLTACNRFQKCVVNNTDFLLDNYGNSDSPGFSLFQGNAVNFPSHEIVQKFMKENSGNPIVLITSKMVYELPELMRASLMKEIENFMNSNKELHHWLSFNVGSLIHWNGEVVVKVHDVSITSWDFVDKIVEHSADY